MNLGAPKLRVRLAIFLGRAGVYVPSSFGVGKTGIFEVLYGMITVM
jgi:hypothetical protein